MGRTSFQFLAAVFFVCLLLTACQLSSDTETAATQKQEESAQAAGTSSDISLALTVYGQDNGSIPLLISAVKEHFPETDITWTKGTSDADLNGDICISTIPAFFDSCAADALLDLSACGFLDNYYLSDLNNCQIDGRIYYLPGPSETIGIVYNKDLFREHGWLLPKDLDTFLELCREIRAAGYQPLMPDFHNTSGARLFFTGFTYDPLLAGIENYTWFQKYTQGEGTITEYGETAVQTMKRLLDEGIWTPEDFERSVSDLNRAMYQECTCAMTTGSQASLLEAEQAGASLHLGLFPFYSSSDNNSDYLFSSPAYYVAASRDLTLPGNEARLAKVLEILEFISTPHGQLDIISQDYPLVSPVRDAIIFNGPFLDTAAATIRKGHLVPMPLFGSMPEGTGDKAVYQALQLFGEGAIDEGTVLEVIDEGVKSEGEDEKAEGGRGID